MKFKFRFSQTYLKPLLYIAYRSSIQKIGATKHLSQKYNISLFNPTQIKTSCRRTPTNQPGPKSLKEAFRGGFEGGLGEMKGGSGNEVVGAGNRFVGIEKLLLNISTFSHFVFAVGGQSFILLLQFFKSTKLS